jgi:hypothetical protein
MDWAISSMRSVGTVWSAPNKTPTRSISGSAQSRRHSPADAGDGESDGGLEALGLRRAG